MRGVAVIVLALGIVFGASSAYGAAPKELEPLEFLIGEWGPTGTGAGTPGGAAGSTTFAMGLQDRVIIRTNFAEYPVTSTAPASRHDDLMIIYAAEGNGVRAEYYDNEGHVIHYVVTTPAPGEASFVSEIVNGAPRFRLSYKLGAEGLLKGEFAVAAPDKPEAFNPYLTWESRKVATDSKAKPK